MIKPNKTTKDYFDLFFCSMVIGIGIATGAIATISLFSKIAKTLA